MISSYKKLALLQKPRGESFQPIQGMITYYFRIEIDVIIEVFSKIFLSYLPDHNLVMIKSAKLLYIPWGKSTINCYTTTIIKKSLAHMSSSLLVPILRGIKNTLSYLT